MAVTTTSAASAPSPRAESAPAWVFPLYAGGLAVIYLGERVLSGLPKGAGFVTFVGLLATVAATVLRFSPRFRSGGERRSIESLLAVLSAVGLVGLLVYFSTTEFGATKLGLDRLTSETRIKVDEFARVLWVTLIVIALVPMVFGMPYMTMLTVFASDVLHVGSGGLGLLTACSGAGAVCGALFVASRDETTRPYRLMLMGLVAFGLTLIGFAVYLAATIVG